MNTANKITMFRVVLIPVFLVILYLGFPGHYYVALGVFILASLSDFLDGYIARHYNQVTDFGKFMDPIADKVLVIAAGWSGKVKTASTMVCICLMLALQFPTLDLVCNLVILVTTAYSGIEYFVQNRGCLNPHK